MKRTFLAIGALALSGTTAFADDLNGDWTSYYVGLQFATGELDDGTEDFDTDAFGIHGGYLHDLGSYVVGGELSFDSGDLEVSGLGDLEIETTRLKAIAGYDLGQFLPYLTVGISDLDIEGLASDTGFVYGLGGTYQVSDTFRIGAEYLVEEYDDFDGNDFDVDVDTFELRASYSF